MGRIRDRDDRLRGHGRHLRVPRRLSGVTRGLRRHPQPTATRVLRRHPAAHRRRRIPLLASGSATGSGAHPTTRHHREERQAAPRATSAPASTCRRCCATPPPGVMHSLIYFGFLILLAVTTVLEIDHQMPESAKFLHGGVYQGYAFGGRRRRRRVPRRHLLGHRPPLRPAAVPHPHQDQARARGHPRRRSSCSASPGSLTEVLRIALEGRPAFEKWSFIGYPLSALVDSAAPSTLDTVAPGAVDASTSPRSSRSWSILPVTMLRHMFTSPLNMYLRDRDRPKGAMKPMPNLMETELETFGAATVEDFTWKQLLDTDACTMCGRCTVGVPGPRHRQAARPPRDRAQDRRGHGRARATPQVSPPIGVDPEITISADSLFERITAEEIWACTSCKACDEICPVNIEILDKILDMRRYLSLMESNFPTELGNAYRSMENQGNPWGMSQGERADWARGLDGIDDRRRLRAPLDHEYLYWVGLRRLVRRQEPEGHPGHGQAAAAGRHRLRHPRPVRDVHRRPGPPLGQRVHLPDARHAERRDAQRHGREEDHHAVPALLQHAAERVPAARRQLRGRAPQPVPRVAHRDRASSTCPNARLEERVVYHDSCYLGRHNDVYLAPRKVIGSLSGIEIVESRSQRHQGHVLRRRRRPHVDGGDASARR